MTKEWESETASTSDEKMTYWHNTLDRPWSIELMVPAHIVKASVDDEGKRKTWTITQVPKTVTWAPGETKSLPSRFDRAMHLVTACGHPGCLQGICRNPATAPARARVQGGLAPLLQRIGPKGEPQAYGVDSSLLPKARAAYATAVRPGDVAGHLAAGAVDEDVDNHLLERARAGRK
jgi:hypothetical protein